MHKPSLAAAVVAVTFLALSGCHYGNAAEATPAATCDLLPRAVAHRGGTERAMENTLTAFKAAGEAGITDWELDVRFDIHGTPVVLHDDTVDRVSPAKGPITRLDASKNPIPTDDGDYIPTLREVYDLAGHYNARVLTELKVMPTPRQWAAVAAQIDATIGRQSVTIMSFDGPTVLEAARRIPGTHRALIQAAGTPDPAEIQQYGDAFNKNFTSITAAQAEDWHAAGIRIYAWTIDKKNDWVRLSSWPVDGFITNRPLEYAHWSAGRCRPIDAPEA
ncbi:glycerophosphodiester phosphodiesterase [Actinoplanes sp. NPDC051859]|uniref:glycerophosphodiester phosphodiesterase n=1 Tax=Actinoplanes sp. NPDC051859 TaxID=3363909 RepID=UPI003796F376